MILLKPSSMKKYILFLAFAGLLGLNFSFASGTGTGVEELLGVYTCQNQSMNATFQLVDHNGSLRFEYCRELGTMECFDQRVYGELIDGQIMGIQGGEIAPLDHLTIHVDESTDEIVITVETEDGIGLTFTK